MLNLKRKSVGLLAFSLYLLMTSLQVTAEQPAQEERPTIAVTGSAEINVAPDKMVVSGSIESREKTVAEASAANATLVKSMRSALEAMKISPNDISTERISIAAIQDSSNRRTAKSKRPAVQMSAPNQNNPFGEAVESDPNKLRKPVGFSVVRYFELTISDLKSYEKIYTALVESGVTQVNNATLKTTELRKYKDLARLAAMQAAREKATAMAGVLDASLAGVKSIRESENRFHDPFQNVAVAFDRDESAPAGTMKVSASVNVEFYLGNADFSPRK